MENAKESCPPSPKPAAGDNPNPTPNTPPSDAAASAPVRAEPRRMPFTSLSQVDADFALARALQDQERAYMMLRRNGGDGDGYGSSDDDYEEDYEEDEEDEYEEEEYDGAEHDHLGADGSDYGEEEEEEEEEEAVDDDGDDDQDIDPADFESDEAYAQAVQEAEGRSIAAQLMALAGLGGWGREGLEVEEHTNDAQDAWEDVDPDEYSYEELIALGEVVGTENRGLSADKIPSLSSINYKAESTQKDGNTEQCVICRSEYEDGESLVALSCKHIYHPECINQWLQINKVCPVCNCEVSTSENKQD